MKLVKSLQSIIAACPRWQRLLICVIGFVGCWGDLVYLAALAR
ncbi:MAG: hypothetical protein WCL39_14735 [Armatimonadota bacterium]